MMSCASGNSRRLSIKFMCVTLPYMSICAGVIVAVTFHEVDRAPNAQASAQSNYQGLQDFNRGIEKCHIVYLQKSEIWKGHVHVELL